MAVQPVLMSLDPALNRTGWGWLDINIRLRTGTIDASKLRGRARIAHTVAEAKRLKDMIKPQLIVAEDFPYGSVSMSIDTMADLIGLHGILRYELTEDGTPWTYVHQAHRATWATGYGSGPRADKALVLAVVRERYGHLVWATDDNQGDAVLLADVACGAYGQPLVAGIPDLCWKALTAPVKTPKRYRWPALPGFPDPIQHPKELPKAKKVAKKAAPRKPAKPRRRQLDVAA